LIQFAELDGGWKAVVMEYIRGSVLTKDVFECKTFLKDKVLPKLQEKGYVHGDLRFCNVMKKQDGKLILLDFDWANSIEAFPTFPMDINMRLTWPDEVVPGGYITPKLDEAIVKFLETLM
jgi:tRNA A-37 threonylcarbamoyl transferase component Bud32